METLFLGLAVVAALIGSSGILRPRGVHDKLHYLAMPALLGPAFLTVAILLREGWSPQAIKAMLTAAVLAVSNPVLTQAVARAEQTRSRRKHPENAPQERPEAEPSTRSPP